MASFDRIRHEWLLENVPTEKKILREWLKAGYMEQEVLYDSLSGTPQGGIISPVLANIALDGLEARLRAAFPKRRTASQVNRVYLVRYADDFIVTGDSPETLDKARSIVEEFLRPRGLELSTEKTLATHITKGFDFLGQNVRKYNGKLLIKPSRKSIKRLLDKVREVIRRNCSATPGHLLVHLNPIIRGWANYHRHVVSKETFAAIDHAIFWNLWRWAVRRHPNKHARWIAAKYFRRSGARGWVFSGHIEGRGGKLRELELFKASAVPIVRHIPVRGSANPYEPGADRYSYRSGSPLLLT